MILHFFLSLGDGEVPKRVGVVNGSLLGNKPLSHLSLIDRIETAAATRKEKRDQQGDRPARRKQQRGGQDPMHGVDEIETGLELKGQIPSEK